VDRLIAFISTAKPEESKGFYEDIVGLRFVEESPFALVFLSGETMIRIQKVAAVTPQPDTALGWAVDDLAPRMSELRQLGVAFERFEGVDQDEAGVWTTDDGTKVAWFRDPDGNLLSLTQFSR
jgi:catechol 2,3-dioxygenase-like lactoylglutathione lyase family enzyme